jgi:CheY-like chemotaxis protein
MKLALVVDDSNVQCEILSAFLVSEGYEVVIAGNGALAVEMSMKCKPDLILMNINMPVMNGFDACKKIKTNQSDMVSPIIFITADNSDQAFIDSVEAGGDGMLVWPFSYEVFKAKIKANQRTSDLYHKIKMLQAEQQKDAEIAENLMSGVIESKNFGTDKICIVKQPADVFSGDIQLTAQAPNGDINILLGDFTGHGLRSTIGAVPLSETFRVMTNKGFSLFEIISQVNRQLHSLLPRDLFLAATMVTISIHEKTVFIFNAGLPNAHIFNENGQLKHKFASCHPPLGILPELLPNSKLTVTAIKETERIVLISDGIIEAKNSAGEMFGYSRFERAAAAGVKNGDVAQTVMQEIKLFCESTPQNDDISLIDIPCSGWEETSISHSNINNSVMDAGDEYSLEQNPSWEWQLRLSAERLRHVNPIPIIMNQVNGIEGAAQQWQGLHVILTELFVNALDHGVLGLSSNLKSAEEGFVLYFNEREKRLRNLKTGFVDISLKYFTSMVGGKMAISVKDSGEGFDVVGVTETISMNGDSTRAYNGRGLQLVTQLCDVVEFEEHGSRANAIYLCV